MLFVAIAPSLRSRTIHFVCLSRWRKKKQKTLQMQSFVFNESSKFWMNRDSCLLSAKAVYYSCFIHSLPPLPSIMRRCSMYRDKAAAAIIVPLSFIHIPLTFHHIPCNVHNTSSEFVLFKSAFSMNCSCWSVCREGFIPSSEDCKANCWRAWRDW